jgi:hypothetical protein
MVLGRATKSIDGQFLMDWIAVRRSYLWISEIAVSFAAKFLHFISSPLHLLILMFHA